ncbi:hypothetical protein ACIOUE_32290 [Streptomyces xanthochromogenes]|uniref:hypothetical protein n=1 Tax=Streptomyces xanthochromogenes TaxID=67384 RepID=UPI003811863D
MSTDDPAGRLSRLADEIEGHQLDNASALVAQGLEMISDDETERPALEGFTTTLIKALQATLRVAASRGHRLEAADLMPSESGDPLQRVMSRID